MATSMTLVVLCPNGRRQTVKVTPNTSVLQVLEEACQVQGINPQDYDIKLFNKIVDPSLTVRFANLPNNALLELCPTKHFRQESSVTVALQLESGERLTKDFSPVCTLWDIICHWKKNRNEQVTQDAANGDPVCIYMRTEIAGETLLKQTTLRSLGLTGGRVVIRLIYRPAEDLGYQAHDTTPLTKTCVKEKKFTPSNQNQHDIFSNMQMFSPPQDNINSGDLRDNESTSSSPQNNYRQEVLESSNQFGSPISDNTEIGNSQDTSSQGFDVNTSVKIIEASNCFEEYIHDSNEVENRFQDESAQVAGAMDTSEEWDIHHEKEKNIIIVGERDAVVFNLEDVPKLHRADLPDDFFELTIEDARYLLADLKRQRMALENRPLETSSQKEARYQNTVDIYHQTILRIHFPDRLVLQACFMANETVQTVTEFIRGFLNKSASDFYLYTTPPKTVLPIDATLAKVGLVPAAVVHYGSNKAHSHYLKPEIRCQISTLGAAHQVASKSREDPTTRSQMKPSSSQVDNNIQTHPTPEVVNNKLQCRKPEREVEEEKESSAKVPRWFKLDKK